MKIRKLFTGVIALFALSFCNASIADEGGPEKDKPIGERSKGRPDRRAPGGPDRAGMLKKLDTNGDGKLSDDERLVGMKERLEKSPEMKKRLLEKFDTDPKDGELSDAELTAAITAFGNRGGGGPGERPARRKRGEGKPARDAKE